MTISQPSVTRSIEPATSLWWLFVVWGVASVIVGGLLLFQPIASALILVTIVAVFWLIGGVVDVIAAVLRRTGHWVWRLIGGAVSAIVGLFVLGHPVIGTLAAVSALYALVAVAALVTGLTGLFGGDRSPARIMLSLLQIVLGGLMFVGFFDLVDLRLLVQAIGLVSIGGGIAAAVPAFHLRDHATSPPLG